MRQNSHVNPFEQTDTENGGVAEAKYWRECQRHYRFQPIYRTLGRLLGIELLTAVYHPAAPDRFLSPEVYFARIDVNTRLDIVIEQLQLLCHWRQRLARDELLASVNIDGLTLLALQQSVQAKHLIATMPWLRFELVENLADLSSDTLASLPESCRLWLDDFGCGTANFSSLMQVGYDCIKIARELFILLLSSEEGRRLFPALVKLMTRYARHVVIEGVETQEEWDWVRQSSATAAQGYFLSRPQPFENLATLPCEL